MFAPFTLSLDKKRLGIKDNNFHRLNIEWNIDARKPYALVSIDGRKRMTLPMKNNCQHGIFYLHLLSPMNIADRGMLIKSVYSNYNFVLYNAKYQLNY
jgi:hypothetical protein